MLYPNGLKTPPRVTSAYGWRVHPISRSRTFHYGTDSIAHPGGWNRSPEDGVVVFAGWRVGAGLAVHIQGDTRLWKIYHHARLDVAVGQRVVEGTVTGPTGTTGNSTGVHCHLECWSGNSPEDPFEYIAANLHATAGSGVSLLPTTLEEEEEMKPILLEISNSDRSTQWALVSGDFQRFVPIWKQATAEGLSRVLIQGTKLKSAIVPVDKGEWNEFRTAAGLTPDLTVG